MNDQPYRLARGVRFRADGDGTAKLLVPEGVITLNESAAATLALVNGERSLDAIVQSLCAAFDAPEPDVRADVTSLLETFETNGLLTR